MATERVTERTDGVTSERTVERGDASVVVTPERKGGASTAIIAIAALALIALLVFFVVLPMTKAEQSKDSAVAGAAESVGSAAENVGEAAKSAADAVTPDQ
jgi:hypothetical protein